MVAAGVVASELIGFDARPDASGHHRATRTSRRRTRRASIGVGLLDLVGLDKKRDTTGIRMVLLEAIGRPVLQTRRRHSHQPRPRRHRAGPLGTGNGQRANE